MEDDPLHEASSSGTGAAESPIEPVPEGLSPESPQESDGSRAASPVAGESRSFAAILEGLRSAEDTFYFLIEEGDRTGSRIPVEGAEMVIGWDERGETLSTDPAGIAAPCAVIRKDWTGVMVHPEDFAVILNGEQLTSPRRLRNGDQLMLLGPDERLVEPRGALLVLHEPASLVVLDSLLPNRLPPPVARPASHFPDAKANADIHEPAQSTAEGRRYFGHFTIFELLMMCACTLALAAIIFFVLDNT
jgi:hypothetical protein